MAKHKGHKLVIKGGHKGMGKKKGRGRKRGKKGGRRKR